MGDDEGSRIGLMYIGTILSPLKHYFRVSKVSLDNVVFRLHYRLTALFLFTASTILSVGQMFGDPIDCIVDSVSISTVTNTISLKSVNALR